VSALRIGGAIALVVAAVLVGLLAHDVRTVHSALVDGDTTYAAAPSSATWSPSTVFGGAAERLLGAGDDIAMRRALQRYVNTGKLHLRLDNAVDVETARAAAQDALEPPARSDNAQRSSQALTLLGILAFRASASGSTQSQVDAAISNFTDAVRIDPGNEDAAYDLELLLQATAAHGNRVQPGQAGGFGHKGRRGAGGGQPGGGY
jgi:hypothetical protein